MKELLSLFWNMGNKWISFSYQLYFSAIFCDSFTQAFAGHQLRPRTSLNTRGWKANKTGSLQSRCLHYGGGDNIAQHDKGSYRVRIVCAHGTECQPAREEERGFFKSSAQSYKFVMTPFCRWMHWRSGLPWRLSSKTIRLQCRRGRRHGFDPWVRKIPWRRTWQPAPVFLLEKNPMERGAWKAI